MKGKKKPSPETNRTKPQSPPPHGENLPVHNKEIPVHNKETPVHNKEIERKKVQEQPKHWTPEEVREFFRTFVEKAGGDNEHKGILAGQIGFDDLDIEGRQEARRVLEELVQQLQGH